MKVDFVMSCGHVQTKDCFTTGEQLRIDKQYFASQGLCDKCWKALRDKREKEKREKNGGNLS